MGAKLRDSRRNFYLDLLRAVAISLVILSHHESASGFSWYSEVRKYGWSGVELLFVLSGYLIGAQWFAAVARGSASWRAFYFKRALRILPCYLAVVALYLLFPIVREADTTSPLWWVTRDKNLVRACVPQC